VKEQEINSSKNVGIKNGKVLFCDKSTTTNIMVSTKQLQFLALNLKKKTKQNKTKQNNKNENEKILFLFFSRTSHR